MTVRTKALTLATISFFIVGTASYVLSQLHGVSGWVIAGLLVIIIFFGYFSCAAVYAAITHRADIVSTETFFDLLFALLFWS